VVRSRRRGRAQAIIETAIVIPLMLFLIVGFIGLMVQVELQQQLESATKLAAESTFQAPRSRLDPGTQMPTRCRYARETFEGTGSFFFGAGDGADAVFYGARLSSPYLTFTPVRLCSQAVPLAGFSAPPGPAGSSTPADPIADIRCDLDVPDPQLNNAPVTYCDTWAELDYSRTPLAWAVFWKPRLHAAAEALPPPFRQ
jgi:hypothetical protein